MWLTKWPYEEWMISCQTLLICESELLMSIRTTQKLFMHVMFWIFYRKLVDSKECIVTSFWWKRWMNIPKSLSHLSLYHRQRANFIALSCSRPYRHVSRRSMMWTKTWLYVFHALWMGFIHGLSSIVKTMTVRNWLPATSKLVMNHSNYVYTHYYVIKINRSFILGAQYIRGITPNLY